MESINIDKAKTIKGFMTEEELSWLAMQAQNYNQIIEVGSYLGRSTRALADNTNGRVLALDDWFGPRDVHIYINERLKLFETFQQNIADLLETKKVVVSKIDYRNLNKLKPILGPDMIFIDGDHRVEATRRDISWAITNIKQNGLICGHDINLKSVRDAVKSYFRSYNRGSGSIWWVKLTEKRYGAAK